MSTLTRRQLLTGTAAAAAGLAVTRASAASFPTSAALPAPAASGIEHIVFLCMENRSFDHYLGWLPGAHGRQAGLSYADDHGVRHATHHLTEFQGCGFNDPDHSYAGGRIQYAGGKLDGFRKGANDDYALGYYEKADLPFYGDFVGQSTVFDRWFAPILSATYPNRFYTHAARTDRIDNTSRQTSMPTIWDRLAGAGVPANYYFSDLPFLALWGEKYLPISKPVDSFFAEAASGTLPQFSYLDPFFLGEEQGGSNDDHPHADIRRGQAFVSQVAKAVATSPLWSDRPGHHLRRVGGLLRPRHATALRRRPRHWSRGVRPRTGRLSRTGLRLLPLRAPRRDRPRDLRPHLAAAVRGVALRPGPAVRPGPQRAQPRPRAGLPCAPPGRPCAAGCARPGATLLRNAGHGHVPGGALLARAQRSQEPHGLAPHRLSTTACLTGYERVCSVVLAGARMSVRSVPGAPREQTRSDGGRQAYCQWPSSTQ